MKPVNERMRLTLSKIKYSFLEKYYIKEGVKINDHPHALSGLFWSARALDNYDSLIWNLRKYKI